MFQFVGETLRRLRKEWGKTLERLGKEAKLGRGQLSRIENARQEATFSTLAKILASQKVSRREFFRRYDLVEDEAAKVAQQHANEDRSAAYPTGRSGHWPDEIREVLEKVETFVHTSLDQPSPVAQGAIQIGDLVVLFRVVPRQMASLDPGFSHGPPPAPPESGKDEPPGVPPPARRRKKRSPA
jgi:transcriptional regulator with XRE-family HTH domain